MTRSSVETKASKFSLPEPIDLAKLAAILTRGWEANPDREVEAALKRALNFYIEAVFLHRELSGKSLDDLLAQGFGIEKRWLARVAEPLERIRRENWADTLELDPRKPSDPAREFLADRGVHLKAAWAVLDIIRKAWDARPAWNAGLRGAFTTDYRESADGLLERCKVVRADSKTIYKIPRFLLEEAAGYAKKRRRERKLKSWHTRKTRSTRSLKKRVNKKLRKSSVKRPG